MGIEERKAEVCRCLDKAETEARVLIQRISDARSDLAKVFTREDAKAFLEGHDLDHGFVHISLS